MIWVLRRDGEIYGVLNNPPLNRSELADATLEDGAAPDVASFMMPRPRARALNFAAVERLLKKAGVSDADIEAEKK